MASEGDRYQMQVVSTLRRDKWADEAGTGGGLSAETVQAIRERILGVPQHE